jgi:hypothetical protein
MTENSEICRINADGTTTYHWDNIETEAQRWQPGCDDISVCVSKLLLPLRPNREWVGLTDEDLSVCDEDGVILARYWEAKLKEKNT